MKMSVQQEFIERVLLVALGVFAVVHVVARPLADPPLLDWSIGAWGDPGIYLKDARELALTGTLHLTEAHSPTAALLFLHAEWAVFAILGPGRGAALVVPGLAWLILTGCVMAVFRGAPWVRVLGALLVASPLLLSGLRSPRGDILSLMFFVAALSLALNATTRLRAFGVGFLLGLAPFAKLHMVVGAGAALAGFVLFSWGNHSRRPEAYGALAGAASALAVGLVALGVVLGVSSDGFSLSALPRLIQFVATTPAGEPFRPLRLWESTFAIREPALMLVGMTGLAVLMRLRTRMAWMLMAAAIAWAAALAVMRYDPLRYRSAMVVIFAFAGLTWLRSGVPATERSVAAAVAVWLYGCGHWMIRRTVGPEVPSGAWALVISAVAFVMLRGIFRTYVRPAHGLGILVAVALLVQSASYARLFWTRGYEIEEASRRALTALPSDAVVTGFWAPLLVMRGPQRVVEFSRESRPPTHVLDEVGFVADLEDTYRLRLVDRIHLPSIERELIVGELQRR